MSKEGWSVMEDSAWREVERRDHVISALRLQLEEQRVVVPEPPKEKELYDTLGDEECEASYEAVSHYLMGWRHCSESIRPLSSGEVVATPPPDVVTVPREEWALLREIERYARIQLPGTTLALRDIDALRSGEAVATPQEGKR